MTARSDPMTAVKQRELLEYLDDNTGLQDQALNAGDLTQLSILSEQRARAVCKAAAYIPPAVAWEPEMIELALRVRDRSEQLQHLIQLCMSSVRKDLVALTQRRHLTHYLPADTARSGAGWSV